MLKLRDIMTRDVTTVSSDLTLRDAMELLVTRHVSGAPVVSAGKVVGVISATDLLSFTVSQPDEQVGEGATDEDGWDSWESEPESAEGAGPSGAYFTETWSDTGDELNELRFNDLVGRELDALNERTVGEVMTRRICSLPSSADVPKAADYMRREGIHRLLVMDDGNLSGIVSAMDITRAVADHRLTTRTYVFGREEDFDDRGGWEEQTGD
ncbi:MAG TPA: CBS domain-containing protein [Gemmatimonadaceae bacterium]|nr:CBS domain-containing protein [Gemmatimonadaceae bacterium]